MPSADHGSLYLLTDVIALLVLNTVFAIIAVTMAKKRGLLPVPAFFSAFFGSFIALFYISLFPIKTK